MSKRKRKMFEYKHFKNNFSNGRRMDENDRLSTDRLSQVMGASKIK
jgi:hypothetical protein